MDISNASLRLRRASRFGIAIVALFVFRGAIDCGANLGSQFGSSLHAAEPPTGKTEKSATVLPIQAQIDVGFAKIDGRSIAGDFRRPADDLVRPIVLLVHGGAWMSGDKWNMSDYGRQLAQAGIASFSINYRLAPRYPHPAQIDDCRSALRYIQENAQQLKIDVDQVGALGYSAGGHLVSLMGTDPKPGEPKLKAVVAGGAPCDFTTIGPKSRALAYFLGGSPSEKPDAYREASPTTHVSADDPPFFFYHGDSDGLVPVANSRVLFDRLRTCGVECQFYEVPNHGHLTTFVNMEARRQAIDFFCKVLAPPKYVAEDPKSESQSGPVEDQSATPSGTTVEKAQP